jgi:hypothetical protein
VPIKASAVIKTGFDGLRKATVGIVTLVAEIAIVAFIGANVGTYLSAKSIVADCARVAMAKVGDQYVSCAVVVPKKDAETQPPR